MANKRIAIACQGGGSQCAFVAGALKTLFGRGVQERFKIVGLSGTSGGALTAALAWMGLLLRARGDRTPIEDRIIACWKDLSAQTPREVLVDGVCTQMLRLAEHGLLPTIASSPSSMQFRLWAQATSLMIGRPEFTDLRALLVKHIDFEALPTLVDAGEPDPPARGRGTSSRGASRSSARRCADLHRRRARLRGDPEPVPGRADRRARLLGRHLRLQPSRHLLLAGAADGEGEGPRRDLDHSGQSHEAAGDPGGSE